MTHAHDNAIRGYVAVFATLIGMLVLTVAVGFIHLGDPLNIIVAMIIATFKATLILLYFMHVKYSPRLIAFFFGAAIYVLMIGGVLTFADYAFRG